MAREVVTTRGRGRPPLSTSAGGVRDTTRPVEGESMSGDDLSGSFKDLSDTDFDKLVSTEYVTEGILIEETKSYTISNDLNKSLSSCVTNMLSSVDEAGLRVALMKGLKCRANWNKLIKINTSKGSMRTVLSEYGGIELPVNPIGILITTASRPDCAGLTKPNQALVVGELKNKNNYTVQSAVRQCIGYLLIELYYERVIRQRDVSDVYGFCVSGPKCSGVDDGHYVVSLLHLSSPAKIGGPYHVRKRRMDGQEEDTKPMQDLARFLRHIPTPATEQISFHTPACMLLPKDQLQGNNLWRMAPNGTSSLVLFDTAENMRNIVDFLEMDVMKKALFIAEFDEANDCTHLVLKVKTRISGFSVDWRVYPEAVRVLKKISMTDAGVKLLDNKVDLVADFLQTCVACMSTKSASFVLMREMGIPFHCCLEEQDSPYKHFDHFRSQFFELTEKVLKVEYVSKLVHGDIHERNVLVSSQAGRHLILIDYDEGNDESPLERKPIYSIQKRQYPKNLIRGTDLEFTQVQLMITFLDIICKYYQDSYSDELEAVNGRVSVDGGPSRDQVKSIWVEFCNLLQHTSP